MSKRVLPCLIIAASAMAPGPALPEDGTKAITSTNELSEFMQGYWQNPRPDLVESALKYAVESGTWKRENLVPPMFAGFSCLFDKYPDRKDDWSKAIAAFDEEPREFFLKAMELKPPQFIEVSPVSPSRNDMNWACYFITADVRYARDVINTMGHLDERKDLQTFLGATSAQWSLASISQDNDKVREELRATAAGKDPELAAAAKATLEKPIEQLREYAMEVLRQQRDAGVWK